MPPESDESADVEGSEEQREDADSRPLSERWNDSSDDDADESDAPSADAADSGSDTDADADPESEGDDSSDDADADDSSAAADTTSASSGREAKTDGDGYARDRPADDDPEYPDPDDDVGGISTPPDDQEMPLADHIEEMVKRLAVVTLMAAVATTIGILWASQAITFIWDHVLPSALLEQDTRPHVYHPLELWMTRIKVAALLGVLVALPALVYQAYRFMRPGLYPHERKYYLSAVPVSLVLALVGMFVSFRFVLPILFRYFTYYADGSAEIHYALGDTFNLIITLTAFLAVVFQIPLFIILAVMMGVTTREWLAEKRLYFWAGFFGLAFLGTFDPTLMAAILVALIMIALFEGTLLLLKWAGR
ncbi:twin-arginine translocase subunit TatC [Natronobiforma cellulositropha]|uniref:twin-arginine translocase subunit TatC n=1 Tax=Natronobiforma cellulositropha TaxID=1679076 RepID=UPI0021D5E193|nr:twin-arginine translocase subunit TatC [Natronobiforma cellulositropha]